MARRPAAISAGLLVLALAVAGCGGGSTQTRASAAASVPTSTAAVQAVLRLDPATWSTITTLAASSTSPGVWLWSTSADDSRVWSYDPIKGTTNSWSLGNDPALRGGAALPALAACDSGVWLGINHDLVHLDPASGAVQHLVVPTTAPVPEVDAHRPAELRGISAIDAVACGRDAVAVGLADAANGFVYRPAGGTFDAVELPVGNEVASVQVTDGGEVAFGLQDYAQAKPHTVLVVGGGRTPRTVEVADSTHLGSHGHDVFAGSRAQPIDADQGTTGAAPAPLLADDVLPALGSYGLPDGTVVVGTRGGLRIVDPSGAKPARDLSLGTVPCATRTGPQGSVVTGSKVPAPPVTTAAQCAVQARAIAVDGGGNVYVSLSSDAVVVRVAI